MEHGKKKQKREAPNKQEKVDANPSKGPKNLASLVDEIAFDIVQE